MTHQISKLLADNAGAHQLHNGGDASAFLMSDHTASGFLGISRATLWRRVKDGTLPNPIRIGAATRWKRDELIAAVERLATGATG